jgi:hypothetical protein
MGLIRVLLMADTHLGFDLPLRPRIKRRRRGPDFKSQLLLSLSNEYAICNAQIQKSRNSATDAQIKTHASRLRPDGEDIRATNRKKKSSSKHLNGYRFLIGPFTAGG